MLGLHWQGALEIVLACFFKLSMVYVEYVGDDLSEQDVLDELKRGIEGAVWTGVDVVGRILVCTDSE